MMRETKPRIWSAIENLRLKWARMSQASEVRWGTTLCEDNGCPRFGGKGPKRERYSVNCGFQIPTLIRRSCQTSISGPRIVNSIYSRVVYNCLQYKIRTVENLFLSFCKCWPCGLLSRSRCDRGCVRRIVLLGMPANHSIQGTTFLLRQGIKPWVLWV